MFISRRDFGTLVGAAGLTTISAASAPLVRAADEEQFSLRVIAYNVYACTGWPKNRERAKLAVAGEQMAERLALELALYAPDIITFSESPAEPLVAKIAERLGMNHVRFPSGGNWPGTLLSRFEIVESNNAPVVAGQRPPELFTRHWGRATIKLPSGDSLIVHSAHLHPSNAELRVREIREMLQAMRENLEASRSMLLLGDLNHRPMPPEYAMWTDAGWVDSFAQVGKGEGLTIKSDRPQWRIDFVMAAGPIANHVVESRPLFEGNFRLNVPDASSFALSDHLPQLAVFEWAE